jgi:hypothetical protein
MRPIKFRAWNGKRMSKPFELKDAIVAVYTVGHGYRTIPFEDEIFTQFTGLLDKNGKEIYEGDVVLLWDEPDRSQVIGDLQLAHMLMSECILSDSCRIIGNIYENPKLLEVKP